MDEPTPVAEILKLVDDYREALHALAIAESHDFTTTDEEAMASALAAGIDAAVTALHAAGVAEGRRQRDEEIKREVFTSARQVAEEAGFEPVPDRVIVSYTQQTGAYEQGIYDAGVEDGRKQAAADVERLHVLLEHAEQYARDLQDNGDVEEREEEWGLRYKLNGKQQEPGDGGHVFDSRAEAEQHLTAWRGFYPNLTYTDVEFMRRETLTTAWVSAGRESNSHG